jgi:hypothetical protein
VIVRDLDIVGVALRPSETDDGDLTCIDIRFLNFYR